MTNQNKMDYERYRAVQAAEHIGRKAGSVYSILRFSLGSETEETHRQTVRKWCDELVSDVRGLKFRLRTLPARQDRETEPWESPLEQMDARADAEYAAWITAYHADHTGRVDFLAAFRVLSDLAASITLEAAAEKYGEDQRHRVLSAAASILEMSESVLELLEYREARKNDTVNGKRPDAGSDPFKKEGAQA